MHIFLEECVSEAAVFNAGTLQLLSQVGCRGQGVALKPLQQHKHPIDSCHLIAAQSDGLHAWMLIMLCSCTLMCTRTHSGSGTHTVYTRKQRMTQTHTHTHWMYRHIECLSERNKENMSCHIIFPGLALTGSLSR